MINRRPARETTLRILYAWEVGQWDSAWEPYAYMRNACEDTQVKEHCTRLVSIIMDHREAIDALLVKYAQNWDVNRFSVIDKNILRIAIAELLFLDDIPPRVAIDEALEIAKQYGSDDSKKFVNGILDAVYKKEITQHS